MGNQGSVYLRGLGVQLDNGMNLQDEWSETEVSISASLPLSAAPL